MSLFSIVIVLILEQVRPLAQQRFVRMPLTRYAQFLESHLNDGQRIHGTIAWFAALLPPLLLLVLLQFAIARWQPLLLLPFNVAVLYVTLGFRQFSHYYTDTHLALRMGELERARTLIAQWRGRSAERLNSREIARLAIEEALLAAHQHVFAPMFYFVVFGPVGAMLYRLALFFRSQWGEEELGAFGATARQAFHWIDWLPLRATAVLFAMVGNFEDAVYCWRTQAASWPDPASGILLASGAGAIGVRLGQPLPEAGEVSFSERPELGSGEEADADFMQSAIGLVWRSLALCLLLLAVFWIASWMG
ncbi:MAG: CobD/CbiB family protein [Sterolibacterium sp.]|nr:CobD/CbiB family protein [Sterolibacterium sp.]